MSQNSDQNCFKCLSDIILKFADYFRMPHADAEDCRITFIEKMMRPNGCILGECNETCQNANKHFLAAYARNHLTDQVRYFLRRYQYETSLEEYASNHGEIVSMIPLQQSITPEEALMQKDLMRHTIASLVNLTNKEIDILVRHGFFEQSTKETAETLHISEEAVDQTLRRARRRLRKILRAKGYIIPGG